MSKLTFDEFTSEIKKALENNILPPFSVSGIIEAKTSRGVYKGISIVKDEIGPLFNLNDMYGYVKDMDKEEIDFNELAAEMIVTSLNSLTHVKPAKDYVSEIEQDVSEGKNIILVPLNKNDIDKYGDEIPHKLVADIPFACAANTEKSTILITKQLFKNLNVSFDKLYETAKNNISVKDFIDINFTEASVSKGYNEDMAKMITVDNRDYLYGSNILTRLDIIEDYIEKYNIEKPAIIPTNKHTITIIDLNDFPFNTLEDMKEIIASTNSNRTEEEKADILSDNLYVIKDGELEIATEKEFELENDKDDIEFDM